MDENVEWLTDPQLRAWRAMLRVQVGLVSTLDRELSTEHKLGLPDYDVLVQLSESPDRSLRMTELARGVLLSPSGLTRRLDGLVRNGYVERRPCPSDGRGLLAVVTDKGLEKLKEMAPTHVRGVREHFIDSISDEDVQHLIRIFEGLTVDTNEECVQAEAAKSETAAIPTTA